METYEFVLGNTISIDFTLEEIILQATSNISLKFYEGYDIENGFTEIYDVPTTYEIDTDVITFTVQTSPFITYKGDTVVGHLSIENNGYIVNKYFKLKAVLEL